MSEGEAIMHTQPIKRLLERRTGFVIHLAIFLVSVGFILPTRFLNISDREILSRYVICYIPLWLAFLAVHYFTPLIYRRIIRGNRPAIQLRRYHPRHYDRDVHSGLFFGVNSFAWISLLAETWATGSSINGITTGAVMLGW